MHVQDGALGGVVQSEDGEPDAVEFGKRAGQCGPSGAHGSGLRFPAVVVREHAEPRCGQVTGGRRDDAVVADVQDRAQRSELARDRAERGHGAARLQRRYHVPEPVDGTGDRLIPVRGRMKPDLLREGQPQQEHPCRDVVQQVLTWAGCGLVVRHLGDGGRAVPRSQVDSCGRLIGGGVEVQPADIRWRTRVQCNLAGQFGRTASTPAFEAHPVAGPPVVRGHELVNRKDRGRPEHAAVLDARRHELAAARLHDRREPRAGRRPRVGQQVHLAAEILHLAAAIFAGAANRDHLPDSDDAVASCGRSDWTWPAGRNGAGPCGRPGEC